MKAIEEHPWIQSLQYPQFASRKFDGIQGQIKNGLPVSKAGLTLPNRNIVGLIAELSAVAQSAGLEVSGEFYSESATFDEIKSVVMSKTAPLQADLKFYMFDIKPIGSPAKKYSQQIEEMKARFAGLENVEIVTQYVVNNHRELSAMYAEEIARGGEGLIVRDEDPENVFKMRHTPTHDAVVIGFNAGKSGSLASLNVRLANGQSMRVNCVSMTHALKHKILNNQADYLGQWVEFTGMICGMKNVPRIGTYKRFRASQAGQKV